MDTYPHRFLNPPSVVETTGRLLRPGSFDSLRNQLREGELLVGTYPNRAGATVATVLDSPARFDEMERLYTARGYYAIPTSLIVSGDLRED